MSDKSATEAASLMWNRKEENRETLEENNPCLKEQERSLRCLDEMNYDKGKCSLEFENYSICKKFWDSVRSDRLRKGILPWMPRREDRERVKAEYLDLLHTKAH